MPIINKKICMIGDFSVGKTSLTSRFVNNVFSDKYLSTVGVKIDSKNIEIDSETVLKLMVWDVAGKDVFTTLDDNYLRGSSGYLLVADGTRPQTIETAYKLQEHIYEKFGKIPFCMLINKYDLSNEWQNAESELKGIRSKGWECFRTSAKTGENVNAAFHNLGLQLL